MSHLRVLQNRLCIETFPIVADDDMTMSIYLLQSDFCLQNGGMFDYVEEQFTDRLEQEHPYMVIDARKILVCFQVDMQAILLLHAERQPGDGLLQPFALQHDRAEVNAQVASNGNGFRKRFLDLIELLVGSCRQVDILQKG